VKLGSGSTPTGGESSYQKSGIALIRSMNVRDGKFLFKDLAYINDEQASKLDSVTVHLGDVLLNITGASVARACRVPSSVLPARVNQHVMIIRPEKQLLDPSYLEHQLIARKAELLKMGGSGATREAITKAALEKFAVTIPPLAEQRRIAEILDRAEALRAKRRNALGLINELHEATFLNLFGDPLSNPKNWTIRSLGSVIAKGPQNGMYKPASEYGSGTPILRIDAFYDGQITNLSSLKRLRIPQAEIQHYGLLNNDIVINRVNSIEYLGKSALIQGLVEPTVFESNMMRFSVDESLVLPVFINFLLQTKALKLQIQKCAKQAVNQASINQKDVAHFEIPVPPLSLQEEFRRRVQSIETLKKQQRQSLAEMDALFESLQHRAFRGEL
jgi:type I restriction enzyme, S subunit